MEPELVMLVGCPASGKSTLAKDYEKNGYHVHSSDRLRAELYGDETNQSNPSLIFDLLHKRIVSDLEAGVSCVFDATNMNRKKRMSFLSRLNNMDVHKKCLLFVVSVDELSRRDASRSRTVGSSVIEKMLRSFECPYYYEGFDEIVPVFEDSNYEFSFENAMNFPQDNPHHNHTLGEHLLAVENYCIRHGFSKEVVTAGKYHDCGKLYTKTFTDSKGFPTDTAHFYNHENYSTYLFLLDAFHDGEWKYGTFEKTLYIANLINWHMKPLNSWKTSEKAKARDIALIGDDMANDVLHLHEADVFAH